MKNISNFVKWPVVFLLKTQSNLFMLIIIKIMVYDNELNVLILNFKNWYLY